MTFTFTYENLHIAERNVTSSRTHLIIVCVCVFVCSLYVGVFLVCWCVPCVLVCSLCVGVFLACLCVPLCVSVLANDIL